MEAPTRTTQENTSRCDDHLIPLFLTNSILDPNADHTRRSLSGAPTTMSSYLSHQTAAILKSDWHVVQIRPTFDPGLFVLWALSGDVMFKIHLSVPRTYYINMRGPNPPPVRLPSLPSPSPPCPFLSPLFTPIAERPASLRGAATLEGGTACNEVHAS